jgi:hypothetical protein
VAVVTRTAYQAIENWWSMSPATVWIPYLYRLSSSPWFDTAEEAVAWAEDMVQTAIDYLTENPQVGAEPPRYTISGTTEVRDENAPTALTDPS